MEIFFIVAVANLTVCFLQRIAYISLLAPFMLERPVSGRSKLTAHATMSGEI